MQISLAHYFLNLICIFWDYFLFSNIFFRESLLILNSVFVDLKIYLFYPQSTGFIILVDFFSLIFWKYYSNYWFPLLQIKVIIHHSCLLFVNVFAVFNIFALGILKFHHDVFKYGFLFIYLCAILNFLSINQCLYFFKCCPLESLINFPIPPRVKIKKAWCPLQEVVFF